MEEVAHALLDPAAGTNIESAILKSNISMQEIVDTFGSKQQLLIAMVAQLSDAMSATLTANSTQPELRERLLEFGQCVARTYASSHLRNLYRIAITESIRHTGLGRDFYDAGPGRLTQRLAESIKAAQARGELRRADPQLLASHFLSLLRANVDMAAFFPGDLGADVSAVVDVFCDGVNPEHRHVELA